MGKFSVSSVEASFIYHLLLNQFEHMVRNQVIAPLSNALGFSTKPPDIADLMRELGELKKQVGAGAVNDRVAISAELAPLLRLIVLRARRIKATALDGARERISDPGLKTAVDEQLAAFDNLIAQAWMQGAPRRMPQLGDYLTLQALSAMSASNSMEPKREYDEKFHILQAPSLLMHDLNHFRDACALRGRSLVLAYLDIDKFKDLNTQYGETLIDREVLPLFMKALEGFVFGRGYAYRYGGDEYAILLPNCERAEGIGLFRSLRRSLAGMRYRLSDVVTTVSIGMTTAEPESFLTDRELEHRAERAKNAAKLSGRNCIAAFRAQAPFGSEEIEIVDADAARLP